MSLPLDGAASLDGRERLAGHGWSPTRAVVRTGAALSSLGWRLIFLGKLLQFNLQQGDIVIGSYPRSGTTWLQMIMYQIVGGGKVDFEHISEVSPYLERSLMTRRDLSSLPSPRILKTHLDYTKVPKGSAHYIYVYRNCEDVLLSNFHFLVSHGGFRADFAKFFNMFVEGKVPGGSWVKHVSDWKRNSARLPVHFVRYEDLIADFKSCVAQIATFCGYPIAESNWPLLEEHCSFAFMKKHEDKFDHMNEVLRERGFVPGQFVREGKVGSGSAALTKEQRRILAGFEQFHHASDSLQAR